MSAAFKSFKKVQQSRWCARATFQVWLLVQVQIFWKFPACKTGRTAALTRQEADSVSGDLDNCADENNETFAKRHSERERGKESDSRMWGEGYKLSGGDY